MKNMDNFRYTKEAITCNHQSMLFTVNKDEWNTKENTGKPWRVLQYAKGTSQAEVALNSEKIKPVALAIIELCLTEGISQAVSRLVGWSVSGSVGKSVGS